MGAFINGVYHEHFVEESDVRAERVAGAEAALKTYRMIQDMNAKEEAAHARIDAATRRAYRTALDADDDPAPLDLAPETPTLQGIRDRVETGAGDRRQLLADREWLLRRLDP